MHNQHDAFPAPLFGIAIVEGKADLVAAVVVQLGVFAVLNAVDMVL